MTRRTRWAAFIGATLLATAALWFASCGPSATSRPSGVLLITLDTIRADRLGAYGDTEILTPFVDSLAARGVLFEDAISPAPLTLPSHTSLLTGTYPPHHGVRDNGDFTVPQDLVTLAELFRGEGFRTGAFVGAFVLDRRWGLDQGFEEYSGDFDIDDPNRLTSIGDVQRTGDQVVDDALAWLAKLDGQPFFAWVHLYDPHDPYDPPAPYRERYAGHPYLGEIAFADSQLQRLEGWLHTSDRLGSTLVVFAGDHGEAFGEHDESGHGLFLYRETVRVPLIIADPIIGRRGSRRGEVVSLIDIYPTLCDRFGLQPPPDLQGQSLLPLLTGRGRWHERAVYSETLYPFLRFSWSPLSSLQDRRHQYIESSRPELYDVEDDPGELRDLAASSSTLAEQYRVRLASLVQDMSRHRLEASRAPDPATVAKLAALGYVSGGSSGTLPDQSHDLPAPRDRIDVYTRLQEARQALQESAFDRAGSVLEGALRSDPTVAEAYSLLGKVRLRQGRPGDAEALFAKGLELKAGDIALSVGLATARLRQGRAEAAVAAVQQLAEQRPDEAWPLLVVGSVARQGGLDDPARRAFEHALELDPDSAAARLELAVLALGQGKYARADELATAALKRDSRIHGAHLCRAQSLEARDDLEAAVTEYEAERHLAPHDYRAAYGLARLRGRLGDSAEEGRLLRVTLDLEPDFAPAYLFLARNLMAGGEDYVAAISLVQQALAHHLEGADLALAYYLLADLYNRTGDQESSLAYAARGRRAERAVRGRSGTEGR